MSKDFPKRPGRILAPEDLTPQQMNASVLGEIMKEDAAIQLGMDKAIEDAISIGQKMANQLSELKPVTRALIVKTLYEHSMHHDKKVMKVLKELGL